MAANQKSGGRRIGFGLVAGIVLLALGALFLASNLGVAQAGSALGYATDYWPAVLILIGVWLLIKHAFRRLFGPLTLIVVGALLLASNLDVFASFFDWWNWAVVWPFVLIGVGALLLFGWMREGRKRSRERHAPRQPSAIGGDADGVRVSASVSSDDSVTVMGEVDESLSSEDIDGYEKTVVMGSARIDLRDSEIAQRPATITLTVVMGEARLRLPPAWAVRIDSSLVMGHAHDNRPAAQNANSAAPDLIVKGTVLMASLQIDE